MNSARHRTPRRHSLIWLLALWGLWTLSACAAGSSYDKAMAYDSYQEAGDMGVMDNSRAYDFDDAPLEAAEPLEVAAEPSPSSQDAPGDDSKQPVPVPREQMIIYNADIGVEVFKVEETLAKVRALNKEMGGWVQQSTSTSLTMRIPVKEFDAFVEALSGFGDVTYKNVVGTDVTEQFFDLQIRMNNAVALRERYIELLKEAKSVEASLAIEKELARLTADIESMKGRLRYLKDRAAFSTITFNVALKNPTVRRSRVPLPFRWLSDYNLDGALN